VNKLLGGLNMEVNSIYSSKMFPLTRHMRSAGLNVYNSAQLSDKIANIISKEQNNSIGNVLDVYV
jgi:hypothetical protein